MNFLELQNISNIEGVTIAESPYDDVPTINISLLKSPEENTMEKRLSSALRHANNCLKQSAKKKIAQIHINSSKLRNLMNKLNNSPNGKEPIKIIQPIICKKKEQKLLKEVLELNESMKNSSTFTKNIPTSISCNKKSPIKTLDNKRKMEANKENYLYFSNKGYLAKRNDNQKIKKNSRSLSTNNVNKQFNI